MNMIVEFNLFENKNSVEQKYIDDLKDNLILHIYKRKNSVKRIKVKSIDGKGGNNRVFLKIFMSNNDIIEGYYNKKDNSISIKINNELIYDVDYKKFTIDELINKIVIQYKNFIKEKGFKIKENLSESINFNDWEDEEINEEDNSLLTNKDFVKFLKDNGVYDKFIHNCKIAVTNSLNFVKTWKTIETFCIDIIKYRYIRDSFDWRKTKEGYNFWSKINEKWRGYLNNG